MARRLFNAYQDWYLNGATVLRMNSRPVADGFPRIHVKRCGGWDSVPDPDIPQPFTPGGRMGEVPFPATTRGKTLTYELQLQANSEPDLNSFADSTRGAVADVSTVGMIIATPWPGHGTDIWGAFARVLAYDGDEEAIYTPDAVSYGHYGSWKRDPILSFRLLDGRWLWLNESGTLFQGMSFSGNPGTGVTVTNNGKAPTPPKITVYGVTPGQDLHIGRNLAGGGSVDLWFRNPVGTANLTGAQTVIVDFSNQSATIGATDVTQTYDAGASTWWDEYVPGIPPGTHVLFRGAGAGTGIDASLYSASW